MKQQEQNSITSSEWVSATAHFLNILNDKVSRIILYQTVYTFTHTALNGCISWKSKITLIPKESE